MVVIHDDSWMDVYDDQIDGDFDAVESMPAKIMV
jgi:hypothetical protein